MFKCHSIQNTISTTDALLLFRIINLWWWHTFAHTCIRTTIQLEIENDCVSCTNMCDRKSMKKDCACESCSRHTAKIQSVHAEVLGLSYLCAVLCCFLCRLLCCLLCCFVLSVLLHELLLWVFCASLWFSVPLTKLSINSWSGVQALSFIFYLFFFSFCPFSFWRV